jgi:hypothetical protein
MPLLVVSVVTKRVEAKLHLCRSPIKKKVKRKIHWLRERI